MKNLYNCQQFLSALEFASIKHERQYRKGPKKRPYINHPIQVVRILTKCRETDIELLNAAILHDVIEDTDTEAQEIREKFGEQVARNVLEVTDNMCLSHKKRKEQQILKADKLSVNAKKIKIADKTANITDLLEYPLYWNKKRKYEYILWCKKVIDKCRNVNPKLEEEFDNAFNKAVKRFK